MITNRTTESRPEYTDDIERTVVAFANTEGGRIYIGISGVESMVSTMRRITNMIRDSIRPDVSAFTECTVETVEGRPAVVLTVQRGTARPYYLTGKGIRPEGVYLRQGASSVPASETAILGMIKETGGDCYEDSRSVGQQLTFAKAERYFSGHELAFDDEQKRALKVIGPDGTYTNLGMLLSDQCVHTIRVAAFEGSKKTVFRARKELSGSLLEQLDDALSCIGELCAADGESGGPRRDGKQDYPPEALREVLVNAITHRDYSYSGSTLISVFDDRIEFVTIGGLVHGLTLDDVMLGVSAHRNPNLANVFYRLKLIDAYGAGILKIYESYAGCAVSPRFEVTDNAFKVTLPNMNYAGERKEGPAAAPLKAADNAYRREGLLRPAGRQSHILRGNTGSGPESFPSAEKADRRNALLRLAEKQGCLIRKDVETELKVSQATAILILRDMVEQGLLVKEGSGKQQKYHIAER